MDDFKRIFARMDIKQIYIFLLCGIEDLAQVYLEIGMKEGVRLLFQLLQNEWT